MKIGILGSGNVGQALAKGFLAEGREVLLATHEPDGDKGAQLKKDFPQATVCTFAVAAEQGGLLVLAVPWSAAQSAIELAGVEHTANKTVIDATNVIDRAGDTMVYGFPSRSAAEQIQQWLPESRVVKAFNTVGADLMYKPDFGGTKPTMFIAGNDADAKQQVSDMVMAFGWEPLDAGSLTASRELEAMALVWIRNSMSSGRNHAFKML
jgi:hypothetical protein